MKIRLNKNLPIVAEEAEIVDSPPKKSAVRTRHKFDAEIESAIRERLAPEDAALALDALLQKSIPPKRIERMIKDICEAEDIRYTKDGLMYTTPNWEARDKGLTRLLGILRIYHGKSDENVSKEAQPTKIIFQVINNNVNVEKKDS